MLWAQFLPFVIKGYSLMTSFMNNLYKDQKFKCSGDRKYGARSKRRKVKKNESVKINTFNILNNYGKYIPRYAHIFLFTSRSLYITTKYTPLSLALDQVSSLYSWGDLTLPSPKNFGALGSIS